MHADPNDGAVAPSSLAEKVASFSLYAPWAQADPVGLFDELREAGPVLRSQAHGGFWFFTRYDDIAWAAKNPDIFSSAQPVFPYVDILSEGEQQIPLALDGTDHRKWRQALSDIFSPRTISHFTPAIQAAAADLVERIVGQPECDFIQDFAIALPAQAFLIDFGISQDYLDEMLHFKNWLVREAIPNAKSDQEMRATTKPLRDFFAAAVEARRADFPPDAKDVISLLLQARFDGRELTMAEMTNTLLIHMLASLDTTTSALGLIWYWLARNPDQRAWMIDHPEQRTRFVEELLRTQPVNSTARVLTRDVERHGVTMRKGDHLILTWGMSGLDPDAFDDPKAVDTERAPKPQLAFGLGPHRCIGMHLARRIIITALDEWHQRIPDYRLTEGTTPARHFSFVRGLDTLRLTLS